MKCALIGKPLGHSYSKEIHALIAPYSYDLVELDESEVAPYLKKRDFDGINVTIPYKQTVMPLLDEISDEAKKIGAVNTIVNEDGRLVGYNTDFAGMRALILKNGIDVSGKKALVLGTGGTSKTATEVLKSLGAGEVIKVSRTAKDGAVSYEDAYKKHSDAKVIVNATPVGMYPHENEKPVDIDRLPRVDAVIDAIYHPLCTELVIDAKRKGIKACGGLYMLVAQAVYACGLFQNKEINADIIDDVYEKVLTQKRNIVLVGMPSCGKTTIANEIARITGRVVVDTDREVEKRAGVSISQIFEREGEGAFRALESEVVSDVSSLSCAIISTGGGVPLNDDNIKKLSRNGIILFLDRDVDKLVATSDRPLAQNVQAIKKLYEKRYPIYVKCADARIDSNGSVQETINSIRELTKI